MFNRGSASFPTLSEIYIHTGEFDGIPLNEETRKDILQDLRKEGLLSLDFSEGDSMKIYHNALERNVTVHFIGEELLDVFLEARE